MTDKKMMQLPPLTEQEKSSQRRYEAALPPDEDTRRPVELVTFIDGRDDDGNHVGAMVVTIKVTVQDDIATLLTYDFPAYVGGLDDAGLDYAIADYKALIHRLIAEKYRRRVPVKRSDSPDVDDGNGNTP